MAVETTVTSYGVPLRLRAPNAGLLATFAERLPRPWKPSKAQVVSRTYALERSAEQGRAGYVVLGDGQHVCSTPDLDGALYMFEAAARFHVAASSAQRAFVHAGVVAYRGHAVILPGPAGAGKTTLTAALVRAGATYLSDEFAPVDDRGRVHPFPKALSIVRLRGTRPLAQSVESLGGVQETRALPVALVVLTSYAGNRRRWRPQRLTSGQAVLELLGHTVSAQRWPAKTLGRLERMIESATVLLGDRGDADETAALILKKL